MGDNEIHFVSHKRAQLLSKSEFGLFAYEKPPGVLSVPNSEKDLSKSLIRRKFDKKVGGYFYINAAGTKYFIYPVHRLDNPTSGVILMTTDREVLDAAKEAFKERTVIKRYHAVVFGVPRSSSGVWKDLIETRNQAGQLRSRIIAGNRGQEAGTEWKLLEKNSKLNISLMELTPKTGRTHQLRVQCANKRLPIVGDQTYGDFAKNQRFHKSHSSKRLYLHSSYIRLKIKHRSKTSDFEATSTLPDEFRQLFDN